MGLKLVMEQSVGDNLDAVQAEGTITCEADNWANDLSINVVIPNDTDTPDSYTKNDFTDPVGDDNALAIELETYLGTIGALEVTRVDNVLTVKASTAGRAGNDIALTTNYASAFAIVALANGRDENEAIPMEMELDEDTDVLTMKVDGNIVFKTKYVEEQYDNRESFQKDLHQWFKKAQQFNIDRT